MKGITATKLFCEYAANPIGLDVVEPRFSWMLESDRRGEMQTAYQILVAGSRERLASDIGDNWDSSKVFSGRSVNVPYGGSALSSGEECFWKVRVWDGDGREGAYSEPARFEMGLLRDTDWHGDWIQTDDEISSPLFRKVFALDKEVERARVHICGLGLFELYLNGKKVGDHVLDPVLTDYRHTVAYVTHDVTELLAEGDNVVAVMLGNGWYRGLAKGRFRFDGSLKLLLEMNIGFTDGTGTTIPSNTDWKACAGPIAHNTLQDGEVYDARLESPRWNTTGYDDSDWAGVREATRPPGALFSQALPAMSVVETRDPVRSTTLRDGAQRFDFGQLFSGWVRVRLKGARGASVTITYASRALPDGSIDDTGALGAVESDTYILRGDPDGETYEPRFTFHPVRFVRFSGNPQDYSVLAVTGLVVHTAMDPAAEFACSNDLFNRIHGIVTWTLRNALKGFPMDCLHREPLGYNEPASVSSILFTRTYMPRFWTKWLKDIRNNQRPDGSLSDFAPELPGSNRNHDASQAGNYPALVWYLYEYYDDERMLSDHYPAIVRWIEYLGSIAQKRIVTEGWLGDHMLPGPSAGYEEYTSGETPPPLIWTGYYYKAAIVAAQAASVLGRADDAGKYAALAESIRKALNAVFFDEEAGHYATGSQTADAFPLDLGLVPEGSVPAVRTNLVQGIMVTHGGHIHTGHVGTASVLEVLMRHDESDVLFSIASKETYPGWGYMVAQGATTIWESWGHDFAPDAMPRRSHRADSMMMWGSIDKLFFDYLAGIGEPAYHGQETTTPGFSEIEIRPHVIGDLTWARARIMTGKGTVASGWRKGERSFGLDVGIPVNSTARVIIPKLGMRHVVLREKGAEIFRQGSLTEETDGVFDAFESLDSIELFVGSGSYSFTLEERGT